MAARVSQVVLTPTGIFGLYGTPVAVLPAPPLGFVNNILSISHQMTYVSAAYTTATKLLYSSGGAKVLEDDAVLAATGNYNSPALKSAATQTVFSTTQALNLTTDALAATGNSTINVYIVYEQVQIGV
jgi:hypothetical protein